MKYQKITSIAATIAIVVSIAMVFGTNQDVVTAEEKEAYPSANNVKIKTTIRTVDGTENVDFQVYVQKEGYDRENDTPQFQLIGVVDGDRAYLYKIADTTYLRGKSDYQLSAYAYADIDVSLVKDGITLRSFKYEDCHLSAYRVFTDYDKEEGWFGKGFATLDDFTFTCAGYQPQNILMDYMNIEPESSVKTTSTMDLKEKPDYTTHPKFQN